MLSGFLLLKAPSGSCAIGIEPGREPQGGPEAPEGAEAARARACRGLRHVSAARATRLGPRSGPRAAEGEGAIDPGVLTCLNTVKAWP